MIWLTLRQHRLILAAVVVAAIALAVTTAIVAQYARATRIEVSLQPCSVGPFGGLNCQDLETEWGRRLGLWRYVFFGFILAPALVASYVGGPLFAREFERGTHRFVLTQAVSRARWAATKLGVVIAVALLAGAVLALAGGQSRDLMSGSFGLSGRRIWDLFDFEAPALIGVMVFGIAAAAFVGAATRRILTGMFVGILLFGIARGAVTGVLRPNYEPPIAVQLLPSAPFTPSGPFPLPTRLVPEDAWVVGTDAVDGQGRRVPIDRVVALLDEFGHVGCRSGGSGCDSVLYLNQHDVYQRQLYQPADRYWRFQAIETVLYLGLATFFAALTIVIVKRRDA